MSYEKYSKIISQAAFTLLKTSLMAKAVSLVPFLSSKLLYKITEYIIDRVANFIIYKTEMRIFFAYTDLRVNAQGRKFLEAVEVNQEAREGNDEELKARTEKLLIDSAREFIKLR
jgi:hypothetical protein